MGEDETQRRSDGDTSSDHRAANRADRSDGPQPDTEAEGGAARNGPTGTMHVVRNATAGERTASEGATRGALSTAVRRVVREPALLAPYLLAGLVLTGVDWARRRDPVPVVERRDLTDGHLAIEPPIFPTGVRGTDLDVNALLGLEPSAFVGAMALYALGLAAVAGATTVVVCRVLDRPPRLQAAGSLFGYALAVSLGYRFMDALSGGLLTVVLVLGSVYVTVRLFAVPGFLARGDSLVDALRASARLTSGKFWRTLWILVLLGVIAHGTASVPTVGTLASTTITASLHAVAMVTLIERDGPERQGRRSPLRRPKQG